MEDHETRLIKAFTIRQRIKNLEASIKVYRALIDRTKKEIATFEACLEESRRELKNVNYGG